MAGDARGPGGVVGHRAKTSKVHGIVNPQEQVLTSLSRQKFTSKSLLKTLLLLLLLLLNK